MRPRSSSLPLATALFISLSAMPLAGCGPGENPALQAPCSERGPGSVTLGTGAEDFELIGASGVDVQEGPQGGYHIWIGLRCKNLGPRVDARYGVIDVETGADLSLIGLHQSVELVYDDELEVDEIAGLFGYLSDSPPGASPPPPDQLDGRAIQLWAKVSDACGEPVSVTLETKVRATNRL